jgi:putative membrane protein
MKKHVPHLNGKVLFMSLLVNMVSITITAVIIPGISIQDRQFGYVILLAAVLGLLNTFIKPLLQILTIRLLFVSYGLILIVTNTIILLLLAWLFDYFVIDSLLAAIFGAIFISLIGGFLDYLVGVIPPVGYRQAIQEQEATHDRA